MQNRFAKLANGDIKQQLKTTFNKEITVMHPSKQPRRQLSPSN